MANALNLDSYRLLGRSGLRVSPLSLGTMTFGADWGWGADTDEARRMFDIYVDRGGNFIDTSVNYTNGTAERFVGAFMKSKRDRIGVTPWSPLGGGVLTGKYTRADLSQQGEIGVSGSRKGVIASSGNLTERALAIAEAVREVAGEIGTTPAQVALAWTLLNPVVASPIIGARTVAQLEDNLGALTVTLTADQQTRLDAASKPEPIFPDVFMRRPLVQGLIFGGADVPLRA